MRIVLLPEIKDLDGKAFTFPDSEGKPQVQTMKAALFLCIVQTLGGDERLSVTEKFDLFKLAERVHQAEGSVQLSAEEVAKIKERAGKFYNTYFFGALVRILENDADTPKPATSS
jgi:hypothetical protein